MSELLAIIRVSMIILIAIVLVLYVIYSIFMFSAEGRYALKTWMAGVRDQPGEDETFLEDLRQRQ